MSLLNGVTWKRKIDISNVFLFKTIVNVSWLRYIRHSCSRACSIILFDFSFHIERKIDITQTFSYSKRQFSTKKQHVFRNNRKDMFHDYIRAVVCAQLFHFSLGTFKQFPYSSISKWITRKIQNILIISNNSATYTSQHTRNIIQIQTTRHIRSCVHTHIYI